MWRLRLKETGEPYLTYDKEHPFSNNLRGRWELLGLQSNTYVQFCAETNERAGLLCANDDEGNIRVLILED